MADNEEPKQGESAEPVADALTETPEAQVETPVVQEPGPDLASVIAERDKLAADLKVQAQRYNSLQGQVRKFEREGGLAPQGLANLERRLVRQEEILVALADMQQGKEVDVAAIRAQHSREDATQRATSQRATVENTARQTVGKVMGRLGISVQTFASDPRFEQVRAAWAMAAQDSTYFQVAADAALDALTEHLDTPARQQARAEKVEELRTDTAGLSGSGGNTHAAYVKSLREGKPLPSSQEIDRLVANAMRRG